MRHQPFTPHPAGRLRPVEQSTCLDSSSLAWTGVLDGVFDFGSSGWMAWAARDGDLFRRGWNLEAIWPVRGQLLCRTDDRATLKLAFESGPGGARGRLVMAWEYTFELVALPCPFGGRRWWFRCRECGKLRARLYHDHGPTWRCRACARFTYRSRQESSCRSHPHGVRHAFLLIDRIEARQVARQRRSMRRALGRCRAEHRRRAEHTESPPQ